VPNLFENVFQKTVNDQSYNQPSEVVVGVLNEIYFGKNDVV